MDVKHRLAISAGLAAIAGGIFLTLASASSTPARPMTPPLVLNQHRPVAGHIFVSMIAVNPSDPVACRMGTVGGRQLHPERSSFSSTTQHVIVCSWRIPKGAGGERLSVVGASSVSWRVRPSSRVRR